MQRFYDKVAVATVADGFAIALDGRTAKTPRGRILTLPTPALAEAVAAEWREQSGEIRRHEMPLTRLAATALDVIPEQRNGVVDDTAAYAATDLVCYRAERPADLVRRQGESWQPLLDWLASRYGAGLRVGAGVIPQAQPAEALAALRTAVAGFDDFALAALHALTVAGSSLVIALAVADGRLDGEAAWTASRIDETYQKEKWGDDAEAVEAKARLCRDFLAAARFLSLVAGGGGRGVRDGASPA